MNFLSQFYFLTPMDYSPWFEGKFWPFWRQTKKEQNLRNRKSHAHQNWFACVSHQPLLAWIFWANSIFWPPWTIFCPLSSTSSSQSLLACYRTNEEIKKRKYDQRIREVEHACFSPLVFSTSGGFGPVSTLFIKRLALLHSEKFQRPYSTTVNFIRCRFSFSILKSALRCLRGSRSKLKFIDSSDFCRAMSEAHISST